MSPGTDFVGLDPDLARGLAREAGAASETAGHVAGEVAGILSLAQIDDNGFAALCAEVEEELGLLQDFLEAKATEMELAAAGIYVPVSTGAAAALWRSLTDGTGEGVDFPDELGDDEGTVTMSSSVAAATLATYLSWLGDDEYVDMTKLAEIAANEGLPPEIRAAAQFFVVNTDVWIKVVTGGAATQQEFERFVEVNAKLAELGRHYDVFDVAGQDSGTAPDGEISLNDIRIVAENADGRYDEQQALAQWLLDHGYEWWADPRLLTDELYNRRVFADDPALAVDWLHRAAEDPGSVVYSGTWYESEAGQEWLNAALAAAGSPEQQAEILLEFVAIYQATQPEPVGPLTILHDLLDLVSWLDPTQLADALNAGIYALEGDELNAAISAGGILLPLAGGGAIRMTRDGLIALAARNGDEALEAALKQAIRRGDLTPEKLDEIVGGVRKQFGDQTADSLRRYFDDLRRAPGVGSERPEQLIDELASTGVRHNPDEIVRIARDDSGRVVFLEEGNPSSGLAHIADAHGAQFAQQGIPEGQLPDLLISAVTDGRRVGMQGSRPIFEVEFGGRTLRVAVSVSENGYIVGANPRSMP